MQPLIERAQNALHRAVIDPTTWQEALETICEICGAKAAWLIEAGRADGVLLAGGPLAEGIKAELRRTLGASDIPSPALGFVPNTRPFGVTLEAGLAVKTAILFGLLFEGQTAVSEPAAHSPEGMVLQEMRRAARLVAGGAVDLHARTLALLDRFVVPAAMVNSARLVLRSNAAFMSIGVISEEKKVLKLKNPESDREFGRSLAAIEAREGRVFSIPALIENGGVCVAHVIELTSPAERLFIPPISLLAITRSLEERNFPLQTLHGLFGLTRAETRLVEGLVAGRTLADIAVGMRLSPETLRVQLRSVFAKTGIRRQADLFRRFGIGLWPQE